MINNRFTFIITLFSIVILLSSCAKEGPTGPTGPAGPGYTGSISGHVSLYDKYGNKVLAGLDSTNITLTGITVASLTSTATDAAGAYNFGNVYTGDYSLSATHVNYGATLLNSFPFLLGALNKDIRLSAIPDSFVTSLSVTHYATSLYDSLVINVIPDPMPRNCIIFLNNTAAVNNTETNYLLSFVRGIPANSSSVSFLLSKEQLTNAGFKSGLSELYLAAYSYVVNDGSVYEDLATGKNVYNAVNANPVIDSVIAP